METVEDVTKGLGGVAISSKMFAGVRDGPIKDVYKITRKIGSGAYGEVRK